MIWQQDSYHPMYILVMVSGGRSSDLWVSQVLLVSRKPCPGNLSYCLSRTYKILPFEIQKLKTSVPNIMHQKDVICLEFRAFHWAFQCSMKVCPCRQGCIVTFVGSKHFCLHGPLSTLKYTHIYSWLYWYKDKYINFVYFFNPKV